MANTVSCFVGASSFKAACAAAFGFGLGPVVFTGRAVLGARLIPRDGFAVRFANFDFCLLVAIRLSLVSTTASRAATATSPAIRQGNRRGGPRVKAPSGR